jgi:hypothetical protein
MLLRALAARTISQMTRKTGTPRMSRTINTHGSIAFALGTTNLPHSAVQVPISASSNIAARPGGAHLSYLQN